MDHNGFNGLHGFSETRNRAAVRSIRLIRCRYSSQATLDFRHWAAGKARAVFIGVYLWFKTSMVRHLGSSG